MTNTYIDLPFVDNIEVIALVALGDNGLACFVGGREHCVEDLGFLALIQMLKQHVGFDCLRDRLGCFGILRYDLQTKKID